MTRAEIGQQAELFFTFPGDEHTVVTYANVLFAEHCVKALQAENEALKSAIKTVTLRKPGDKKPLAKVYRKDGFYHCDAIGSMECTITTERGERVRLHK